MEESNEAVRLDTISVTAEVKEQLTATQADLFVNIVGSSFFTGSTAMKKTKEVNDLVAALAAAGVAEKDVDLESVQATASAGILRKSSSARYHLRVRCATLELVGEAIGAVTAQKNAELEPIVWRYNDADGVRDRLLDSATRLAHDRAKRIASHLGIRLAGVHRFAEGYFDPEQPHVPSFLQPQVGAVRSRGHSIDRAMDEREPLGMGVSHIKEVRLRVEVDYYVSDYIGTQPPFAPAS